MTTSRRLVCRSITSFVIRAGWDIPVALEQGINSRIFPATRALSFGRASTTRPAGNIY